MPTTSTSSRRLQTLLLGSVHAENETVSSVLTIRAAARAPPSLPTSSSGTSTPHAPSLHLPAPPPLGPSSPRHPSPITYVFESALLCTPPPSMPSSRAALGDGTTYQRRRGAASLPHPTCQPRRGPPRRGCTSMGTNPRTAGPLSAPQCAGEQDLAVAACYDGAA